MHTPPPRLIEVDFPLSQVSAASAHEKNVRHGHISTLHIWWARRPLAASRATALAALLPDDPERREALCHLVARLAPWEAVAGDDPGGAHLLSQAREHIRRAFDGRPPRVLDPFAGGGSIPLEALRLGCEAYALDYNPVAVLLNKAVLDYPQRFGSALLDAVRKWGAWVLEQARRELAAFYPPDPDGSLPVGYLWARTVPCQNPSCGAEIPLMRQTWLAKTPKRRIALRLIPNPAAKRVDAAVVGQNGEPLDFDPDEGTVTRAHARCPLCGSVLDDDTTRRLFREGKAGQRLMAVVLQHPHRKGKRYRLPTAGDEAAFRAAQAALPAKRAQLHDAWGIEPVPDEPTPAGGGRGAERAFSVHKYGMTRWGDLFNPRQQLALITFADAVRRAHAYMRAEGVSQEMARGVVTYLALVVDELARFTSVLNPWKVDAEAIVHAFGRPTLSMIWDYCENVPIGKQGGTWEHRLEETSKAVQGFLFPEAPPTRVQSGTATALPWGDDTFDAVLTDPPYYDNVPYSDLSDFFYVWLKRTVGDLYPELFATPLAPKGEEMVADATKAGGMAQATRRFESRLTQAFREIRRVLKPDGIAVIVFAHKTTEAWETVINALLEAGLYMTASWPIHTEMKARLRAKDSAALASSIYMVCRKRQPDASIGEFPAVREEIEAQVRERLARFWREGVRGADFFMSAIGPAVQAFGKYARVEKLSGELVGAAELLEYVRKVVAEFALGQILHGARLGEVDAPTRFYLLWRWAYNHARVPFDEARKLASGVGVELSQHWQAGGLVARDKTHVRVLAAHERAKSARFERAGAFGALIDALHYALILHEHNRVEALDELLAEGYGANEAFWQTAQAISEVLPEGDREKRAVQGLLYSRRLGGSPASSAAARKRAAEPTLPFPEE